MGDVVDEVEALADVDAGEDEELKEVEVDEDEELEELVVVVVLP